MTSKKQAKAQAAKKQHAYESRIQAKQARRERVIRLTAVITIIAMALAGGVGVLLFYLQDDSPAPAASVTPAAEADTTSLDIPDPALAEGRTWTAVLSTNQGDITLELDGAAAPQAVASFVSLAQDDYFNQTDCHRITTAGIYVLQCGDPTGTGTGGPGYTFGPIENAPEDDVYPAGTLAMARQGGNAESMGSQFFLVYEDSTIPSDSAGGYTVFGHVVDGLDIVERVAEAGIITGGTDGRPVLSVIVNEVSVS